MTTDDDIATLQDRLARAEAARDAWRLAGVQERYLEACAAVDALERRLEEQLTHASAGRG